MNLDELYHYAEAIDRRLRYYQRNWRSRLFNCFKIHNLQEKRLDVWWMIRVSYLRNPDSLF
jgi:hypothetical protein